MTYLTLRERASVDALSGLVAELDLAGAVAVPMHTGLSAATLAALGRAWRRGEAGAVVDMVPGPAVAMMEQTAEVATLRRGLEAALDDGAAAVVFETRITAADLRQLAEGMRHTAAARVPLVENRRAPSPAPVASPPASEAVIRLQLPTSPAPVVNVAAVDMRPVAAAIADLGELLAKQNPPPPVNVMMPSERAAVLTVQRNADGEIVSVTKRPVA